MWCPAAGASLSPTGPGGSQPLTSTSVGKALMLDDPESSWQERLAADVAAGRPGVDPLLWQERRRRRVPRTTAPHQRGHRPHSSADRSPVKASLAAGSLASVGVIEVEIGRVGTPRSNIVDKLAWRFQAPDNPWRSLSRPHCARIPSCDWCELQMTQSWISSFNQQQRVPTEREGRKWRANACPYNRQQYAAGWPRHGRRRPGAR